MEGAITCTAIPMLNGAIGRYFVYGLDVTCWLAATVDCYTAAQLDSVAGPSH